MSNTIRVLFFATFREILGKKEINLDLPQGANVREMKQILINQYPVLADAMKSALVSVGREFAYEDEIIPEDGEVAIFPPVSGGVSTQFPTICEIIEDELDLNQITSQVTLPTTGAVVLFTGTVRYFTKRSIIKTTDFIEYEAYKPMALSQMHKIAHEIRTKWKEVEAIALVQRVGKLTSGVKSVVVACSAAHRDTGVFEATRYGIDRLKEIVPIWKKEVGPSGVEWVEGTYDPIRGDE